MSVAVACANQQQKHVPYECFSSALPQQCPFLCTTFLGCAQLRLTSVHASVWRFDKEAPGFLKIILCSAWTWDEIYSVSNPAVSTRYQRYHAQYHQAPTAPTVASSVSQSITCVSAVAGGGITSKKWTKMTVY